MDKSAISQSMIRELMVIQMVITDIETCLYSYFLLLYPQMMFSKVGGINFARIKWLALTVCM